MYSECSDLARPIKLCATNFLGPIYLLHICQTVYVLLRIRYHLIT